MLELWTKKDWSPTHNRFVLVPVTHTDAEIMAEMSVHERRTQLTRPRSGPRHRLYWVTLNNVIRSTYLGDRYAKSDHLHKALLLGTGHCTEVHSLDGEVFQIPDSTSFKNMGEDEFHAYFDKAIALLAQELGCDPLALKDSVHA